MFQDIKTEIVPLYSLGGWEMRGGEFVRNGGASFKIIFCDIAIEGREVRRWTQPLFEATAQAVFGLFTTVRGVSHWDTAHWDAPHPNVMRFFLVRAFPETGCFDGIELGPSVQLDGVEKGGDAVAALFMQKYQNREGVKYDVVLSEEGGRFYHEENKNIIIEIDENEIVPPPGYFWLSYKTLNMLCQINNCLNIQLRNLLSLLEV
jgi:oxidase EvaA